MSGGVGGERRRSVAAPYPDCPPKAPTTTARPAVAPHIETRRCFACVGPARRAGCCGALREARQRKRARRSRAPHRDRDCLAGVGRASMSRSVESSGVVSLLASLMRFWVIGMGWGGDDHPAHQASIRTRCGWRCSRCKVGCVVQGALPIALADCPGVRPGARTRPRSRPQHDGQHDHARPFTRTWSKSFVSPPQAALETSLGKGW